MIYRISCPNFIEKNWEWQVLLSAHFFRYIQRGQPNNTL